MAAPAGSSELRELKHEAKPGYGRIFAIVFVILGLYLAFILISSPGPVKSHGYPKENARPTHP